jgi:predicted enzyme related to lactoylglutathione lyase
MSEGKRELKRVTGLGGLFFKSKDPDALYEWYHKHLGIKRASEEEGVIFQWHDTARPQKTGFTVWSIFPDSTNYFDPSHSAFMINFRVENLDALLAALREEGVWVDPKVEQYEYGKFGWIMDPDGNRIELWEPPDT